MTRTEHKDHPTLFRPDHERGINLEIRAHLPESRVDVELWYPRGGSTQKINQIQVGLCDVRAADDIRISYDFDRDGWVVKQQLFWDRPDYGPVDDVDHWYEVAFIPAWGQQRHMTDEQYQHWLETRELPPVPESPQ